MVNAKINGIDVTVENGTTILKACDDLGIKIPRLCYLKELNEIGACRMCVVEVEGKTNLVAACNTVLDEGMSILTDSRKVQLARVLNLKFILSQHDYHCATCVRSGNCSLQTLCQEYNINELQYKSEIENLDWDVNFPLVRNNAKCIKCMRCIQICDKVQTMNVWDLMNTGKRTSVGVKGNKDIKEVDCALCGQCVTHCPTAALTVRDDTRKAWHALANDDKIVICQIAPAVRSAWGEALGLSDEEATVGKMVAAAKKIGFDYVFDTDFSADLTIMEEGHELLERMGKMDGPMFTSCCPGWVRFIKTQYPEYVDNLSTAKSPQQMFGAIAKSYYAKLLDVEPEKIFVVSVMPCSAKKWECDVPEVNDASDKDVDVVLTTREFARAVNMARVNLDTLEECEFDQPLGMATGAGVIFGATGGVMEAALRSAYYFVTGENPGADDFKIVRGQDGIRRATVNIAGTEVHAAVASGLGNARKLMEIIKSGEEKFEFVEIMACPGGCAGGGGQPIHDGVEMAECRGKKLYDLDAGSKLRFSHENPAIKDCYDNFLEKPLGHLSHELLHTHQREWTL